MNVLLSWLTFFVGISQDFTFISQTFRLIFLKSLYIMMKGGSLHDGDHVVCYRKNVIIPCSVPIPKIDGAKWIVLKMFSGKGQNGTIYVIQHDGIEYIGKFIQYSSRLRLNDMEKTQKISDEICLQNICSTRGFAPLIYDYFYCLNDTDVSAVIIMEKINMYSLGYFRDKQFGDVHNIKTYIQTLTNILTVYCEVIKKLHSLIYDVGISHGDLHNDNVLLNPDNLAIKFIDFGNSFIIKPGQKKSSFDLDVGTLLGDYELMFDAYDKNPKQLNQKTDKILSLISDNNSYRIRENDLFKYTVMGFHELMLTRFKTGQCDLLIPILMGKIMKFINDDMKDSDLTPINWSQL